jgi:[acyl-carrier-protein] S-malonyltransferase
MKAYVFPGQGSQFSGMGKDLDDNSPLAKQLFEQANDILGFKISDVMFGGTDEALKQTKITQPAIFLHSVILYQTKQNEVAPNMVAGHSLGEFSALVANKTLKFEDALQLVYKRALAMQKACELNPSTMAAILNLDDKVVEDICKEITQSGQVVVAANYNCPGQLVISGSIDGVNIACEKLKAAGAKRALVLPVGGAINATQFSAPICPVYQNVTANAVNDPNAIKQNLIAQLTAPVKWTQSVQQMTSDGATQYIECGPGKVLQGLVKKISPTAEVMSL